MISRHLLPLLLLFLPAAACSQVSDVRSGQVIAFYPGLGYRGQGDEWTLEIRGCVYEPENRQVTLAAFRSALGLKDVKMDAVERAIFNERARLFLVDNERGRRIVIQAGETRLELGKSAPNGHFGGTVRLSDEVVERLRGESGDSRLRFRAALPAGDTRDFGGEVWLVENTGLTVISDIDDTIKITEVTNRGALLRNTFLKAFQPVPGMARMYQAWAKAPATQFHYVSASPWQLFVPLADFVRSNGFPEGTFHLKEFRWKDRSFFNLFANPDEYKRSVIEPLIERFPRRRFILVGDSGERDPEIYAAIARMYPRQVIRILIRDVTGESADAERCQTAFKDLPPTLWRIFREPSEALGWPG